MYSLRGFHVPINIRNRIRFDPYLYSILSVFVSVYVSVSEKKYMKTNMVETLSVRIRSVFTPTCIYWLRSPPNPEPQGRSWSEDARRQEVRRRAAADGDSFAGVVFGRGGRLPPRRGLHRAQHLQARHDHSAGGEYGRRRRRRQGELSPTKFRPDKFDVSEVWYLSHCILL